MKGKNAEELLKVYEEEIKRKDEIITKLREENVILLRTSLKGAEDRLALQDKLLEMEEED